MIFTELLGSWMRDKQAYVLKRRTYLRYEEIIRTQIAPSIGKLDTGELTIPILQSFQKQKLTDGNVLTGKPLASNTVKNMMSIVRNAIDYGRELGIPVCDTRQVIPLRFEEKQITAFRKDEQKRIEKAVAESKKPNHFGIVLCLYTGLRLGELLALTWDDIDFHTGVLTVNKTSCVLKEDGAYKIHVDRPKTDSSVRVIPIPKPILAELKTIRKKSRAEFVISTCHGGRVSNRSYQTTYARILTRARVDYKNFHVLRHTFATRALECGVDIKTLSELMGHKSPVITMNRYVHSLMETKRKAMNALAKTLSYGK